MGGDLHIVSPSLPSTPRKDPSGHGTESSILYLHSPGVRPKVLVRPSGHPLIQDSITPPALLLPQLKQLDLFDIVISKKAMEHLVCSCTVLEYLRLEQIHRFISLHIASTNLRWILSLAGPATRHQLGRDHSSCSTLWSLRMHLSLRDCLYQI